MIRPVAETGGASQGQRWRPLASRCLDLAMLVWLFLSNGALLPLLFSDPGSTDLGEDARATLRLLALPTLVLAPLLLATRPRAVLAMLLRHPLLPLLLAWVWCSGLWSLDPGTTYRRAAALTAYTAIACWLCAAYPPAALLSRVTWVLLAQLLLSLAFAVALPGLAFMPEDHLLRGIFLHKNVLGQVALFAATLLLVGWRSGTMPRVMAAVGLGVVVTATVLAGSATAVILIALTCALQLLAVVLALPPRVAATAVLLLLAAGSFLLLAALLLLEPALALLGRDLTFTGRADLWAYAWGMISHQPLLGYGYAVFFDLPAVATYVEDALRWPIPNAHNGYLEVALGLGLPGVLLVSLLLVGGLARSLRLMLQGASLVAADRLVASFGCLFLLAYLARNLVESDLASQSQLSWVLAVVAIVISHPAMRAKERPLLVNAGAVDPGGSPTTAK